MMATGEVIFNAQPQKARVAISCSNQRSRVYCLVLYVAQGPTLITRIAPQLYLTVIEEGWVLVKDPLRHPYTLQFGTQKEAEEFCKHVLVAKMASKAPHEPKTVQSIDLKPGQPAMVAEHQDQATVLLTCWLVDSHHHHTIAATPHWTSVGAQPASGRSAARGISDDHDEPLGVVTINVKKLRLGESALGMRDGLLGMRLKGTRLLVLETSASEPGSSTSLKSVLGLPSGRICVFKKKEKEKEKEQHPRDKARPSKNDDRQMGELKAEVRGLEAKLRIAQDTVDKMMGRKLERSSVEELASLEEILLTSYRLVIAQKVRLELKEEEKKKQQNKLGTQECVLCLDKARNAVLVPCGHACCCLGCAKKLTSCPLCRKEITDKLAIYL
ncbi:zinc finger, C3HC4 type (RING finger) domain containing protein [Acanthamoeba castellanii str. Neff]|uniref:Zinc finger, C3HC4 type (RING finger) domain containing protein n=1 Tax=Acanthamoeba castellanii (strain ATCC 30010 / Neff) TaxID=1257118 RepID=L8H5W5_ACACF|nr:zinc finger, C3HC4 type (RING finger) domain containing protein [Acanthamoeba castellanii str. Neff]ELR20545.1 zinc finger, C3HC4 type (RING finger) domain containing protein [Acanthamoeba castellanii str. Neff]